MALIPTLATQILEEMDVEALTKELQSLSSASSARSPPRPPPPVQSLQSASDISSVSDAQSEAGSVCLSSYSGSGHEGGDRASAFGTESWVKHMSSSESSYAPRNLFASSGSQLSDSTMSTSSSFSQNTHSDASSASSSSKKKKAELWKEVKNLSRYLFLIISLMPLTTS